MAPSRGLESEPLLWRRRDRARAPSVLAVVASLAGLAALAARSSTRGAELVFDERDAFVTSFAVVDPRERNEHKRVAVATLRLGGGASVAVRYTPEGSALPPLWSRAVLVDAGPSDGGDVRVDVPLLRLRARHNYTAELFVELGGGGGARARARARFATSSTSCGALSDGALVEVVDGSSFSFEVLVTAWVEPSCASWEGLVALDAEGYCVWHYEVDEPGPVSQLEGGDLVFLTGGNMLMMQDRAVRVDTDTHATRSESSGRETTWTAGGGCGCAERCVWVSHECRVVRDAAGRERVLVEADSYVESPFAREGLEIDGERVRPEVVHGYAFNLWDPADDGGEGEWTELVDLTEAFRKYPTGGMMQFAIHGAAQEIAYTCDDDDDDDDGDGDGSEGARRRRRAAAAGFWSDDDAADGGYMDGALSAAQRARWNASGAGDASWRTFNLYHASSGDVYGGWLLVCTLRNANALLAFNVSGGGAALLWTLAAPGALASDFDDADGSVDFYMPHAVELLSETSLLVMDDGGSRRGCANFSETSSERDAACWSRALEIELDLDAMTARVSREWEAPLSDYSYSYGSARYDALAERDYFNVIGGNVNYLGDVGGGDDRYLVAMPDIVNASYRAWELQTAASGDGFDEVGELYFSAAHQLASNGNYRMTPLKSLSGESSASPLVVAERGAR